MPFGDRTGPRGEGPRTGRGLGYCSGFGTPGYTKGMPRGGGRGFGRGFGRGLGPGRRFAGAYRSVNPNPRGYWGPYGPKASGQEEATESEKEYLASEIEALEEELQAMKQRMKELNKESGSRE
ncbi:MAG: DUF5320 domain-containing protein [Candidatus Bipolaricaulota bacterium]|nr:DUF5320 domain-containing protein [Candidatus Bipolaricaulota bacterium]MBS3792818.1 DUF5320 domain-containing protein [Candidatus Bipolaricaulota bacterium]